LLTAYEAFFSQQSLTLADITASIIERATELRVRHGLKTPDAIHTATPIEYHADLVLTGDRNLARCAGVAVHVL